MAPFDLVIARFERRPYRDKTGELKTPTREDTKFEREREGRDFREGNQ